MNFSKEEKLRGSDNYNTWKTKLERALQLQNLQSYLHTEDGNKLLFFWLLAIIKTIFSVILGLRAIPLTISIQESTES